MQFPHCDARVVHAPGECEFCDRSGLQEIREAWGINFTGHYDQDKLLCPAEVVRSIDSINRWGGNVAAPPELPASSYFEEVKRRRRSLVTALKSFGHFD